jgi:hypothetical protein
MSRESERDRQTMEGEKEWWMELWAKNRVLRNRIKRNDLASP